MLTAHAAGRCQQRGIKGEVVEAILAYGERQWRRGAEVCFMTRQARALARAMLGPERFARIADRLGCYVVVSDEGAVITVAQRRQRLKF